MSEASAQQLTLFAEERANLPLKDDRVLMEFPFFAIQTKPVMDAIHYKNENTDIIVEPGPRGIATIWDKEILIYIASILNDRIDREEEISRTVRFKAIDFLKWAKRGTSKRSYDLFMDALDRLRNTSIRTNIASDEITERRGFGWIESWRVIQNKLNSGKSVMSAVEITLNDWMYRAITKDRRVLTLSDEYCNIRKGLERRLYELSRKHCGKQKIWRITLSKLKEKCGSNRELRRFKADIVKIIKYNTIPDYTLEIDAIRNPTKNVVTFRSEQPDTQSKPAKPLSQQKKTWDLSSATLIEASSKHPGYDIQFLEETWREWGQKKGDAPPSNANRAFLAFCETYTKKHPL